MTCYQSTNLPGGFPTTGRTLYRTEAECNQACKEGACCEGTTCSVKPACQCQGAGRVFNGVGTVCSPNPCLCCNSNGTPKQGSGCQQCWCFCGEGAATYPRFINVSLSGTYKMNRPVLEPVPDGFVEVGREFKEKSLSASVTLSVDSTPSRSNCPLWRYGSGLAGSSDAILPIGTGGAEGYIYIYAPTFSSATSANFSVRVVLQDFSEGTGYQDWKTSGAYIATNQEPITSAGIQTSGTCFSDILKSFTGFTDVYFHPVDVRVLTLNGSITGVQA